MINFERDGVRFVLRIAGVAIHDGYLLLHRGEDEDFWTLPGGRCEMMETSSETLSREMVEELGVAVHVGRLLWVVENFFNYNGMDCHELGLYYAMEFPDDYRFLGWREVFYGDEAGTPLLFRWFPLESINPGLVRPSFLGTALHALPDVTQRVVQRPEPADC
ncbi:MAG: hydrolase [Chlorobi bacterium]|nr:hydrolase [Chlorobiota bacterium]